MLPVCFLSYCFHIFSDPKLESGSTSFPSGSFGSKLEHFETNYMEYLYDARLRIEKCAQSCRLWKHPYDGENPTPTSLNIDVAEDVSMVTEISGEEPKEENLALIEGGAAVDSLCTNKAPEKCDTSVNNSRQNDDSAILFPDISTMDVDKCSFIEKYANEEAFIRMLDDSGSPADKSVNIEDSINSLDSILMSVSPTISCTSTPRKNQSRDQGLTSFGAGDMSTVYFDCETSQNPDESELYKSANETSFDIIEGATQSKGAGDNATGFDIIDSQEMDMSNNNNKDLVGKSGNATSFVNVSAENVNKGAGSEGSTVTETKTGDGMLISFNHFSVENKSASVPKMGILVSKQVADDGQGKGDKSVRFSETTHVQTFSGLSTSRSLPVMGANAPAKAAAPPNIGKIKSMISERSFICRVK